jgi:metallo-beta-lactamase family protein
VQEAQKARGALLIPSFAVERTQELLVDLAAIMEAGDAPEAPIFIDSPLATKASAIFARHAGELANGGALARAMNARHVRFTESVEQSKAISRFRGFHIVLAASGMCEAGRIRHHLKGWLWRPEGTVLLVGYQAQGALGRILQNGATRVRIQGEDIRVRARIRSLDLYSGHADGPELANWLSAREAPARGLFLVHGEQEATAGLAARLMGRIATDAIVQPRLDDVYELTGAGARLAPAAHPPRLDPARVARLDSRNDLSRLMLAIGEAMDGAADERARAALVRKLQRALDEATGR